ncbi:hypothetical protein LMTR13_12535 [Bradyrhizobium icense]|uniref:Uncharacterized protein n=1 Tax=Bradyrhizobium icense TaxID=1274631 RepID=A0A1B1US84_9BRAD|nr:hypothetical protein LMTR13_12535 [Bradyrhizobium icense]
MAAAAARKRNWSRWFAPVLGIALVGLAAFLLYRTLSRYSRDEIVTSLAGIPARHIVFSTLFAAASYLCLTGFDWLALRYVGQKVPYRKAALASFCSLSLGHNIGFAALSSGAIRYRFYSRWGVSGGDIAKIIVFCGTTVGLGLMILGGCALLLRPDLAGKITGLSQAAVLSSGAACLTTAGIYLVLSALLRRPLRIRNWRIEMPTLRLALGQVVIGPINFAFVAGCLDQALAGLGYISYPAVVTAYVIANVSALITHVPGGLGVIETVVLYLLPDANVIGGLLAFRAIYFLLPLAIGAPLFGLTELILKSRKGSTRRT